MITLIALCLPLHIIFAGVLLTEELGGMRKLAVDVPEIYRIYCGSMSGLEIVAMEGFEE